MPVPARYSRWDRRGLTLNRHELVEGIVPRANWPRPDCATYFGKDKAGRAAEDTYLARQGALDDYIDGKRECQILRARPLAGLVKGHLYRMFKRANEHNPRTGKVNGYWACIPGWSSKGPPTRSSR